MLLTDENIRSQTVLNLNIVAWLETLYFDDANYCYYDVGFSCVLTP